MKINKIYSSNFRNLTKISLSLSPSVNVFLGNNGQGKTNFLESIHFLLRGAIFRQGTIENCVNICRKNEEVVLHADIYKGDLKNTLRVLLQKKKRTLFLNEKKISSMNLQKTFSCVLFSPESLSAIKNGPEQRRLLIDDLLVSVEPSYPGLLAQYKKCLRSRNRVLRNFFDGAVDVKQTESILESLTPIYIELAVQLTVLRLNILKEIIEPLNSTMQTISATNSEKVEINYLISGQVQSEPDKSAIDIALRQKAAELRTAERAAGMTLFGPHKHDIQFCYGKKDSRFYCSQGQQRALILSFKIAQAIHHFKVHRYHPVLLLDDVMSELDSEKGQALITFLNKTRAQTLITTTDMAFPKKLETEKLALFNIEQGNVELTHEMRSLW